MKKNKDKDNENMKYVESRLQAWKRYFSRINDGALGFHSKNILAAWREGYTIQNQPKFSRSFDVNEEAEEIEKIVTELKEYDARLATALRSHYFADEKNLREKASEMEISHAYFRVYVLAAKAWVASRICFRGGGSNVFR